jgi:hypothetical protein
MGEIKGKAISVDKVQEYLGENPSYKEIRDIAWRTYTQRN